jgi:hypothetical protein
MGHASSQQLELMTKNNVCQFPRGFPLGLPLEAFQRACIKATSFDFSPHDTNILGARFTTFFRPTNQQTTNSDDCISCVDELAAHTHALNCQF